MKTKIAYAIYHAADDKFLTLLSLETAKLVSVVRKGGLIILGRYGTNKRTLVSILNKEIGKHGYVER